MGLNDGDNQGPDWVDRWSLKIAAAIRKAWPPIRDSAMRWSEVVADAGRRVWPPNRDWINRWFSKTANAAQLLWLQVENGLYELSYGKTEMNSDDLKNKSALEAEVEAKLTKTRKNETRGCIGCCLVVIAVFFVLFRSCSCHSASAPSWKNEIPAYEVVDRKLVDSPLVSSIRLRVVVTGALTESGLNQLLHKLYDEANKTTGFKYNDGTPTHVLIWVYTSRELAESHGRYIATLSKIGKDSEIRTEVDTDLITHANAEPEQKYGLSESKRKEISAAIVTAEDRADAEAELVSDKPSPPVGVPRPGPDSSGFPVVSQEQEREYRRQLDEWNQEVGPAQTRLRLKYKSEVAEKYGLTLEQLEEINIEASTKNWPLPPRKCHNTASLPAQSAKSLLVKNDGRTYLVQHLSGH